MSKPQIEPQTLTVSDGPGTPTRRILMLDFNSPTRRKDPCIVYAGGLMADGLAVLPDSKIAALRDFTEQHGHRLVSFQYNGHGENSRASEGQLSETTLTRMKNDLRTVLDYVTREQPVHLLASSTSASFALDAAAEADQTPGSKGVTGVTILNGVPADGLLYLIKQACPNPTSMFNKLGGIIPITSPTLPKPFPLSLGAYDDLANHALLGRGEPISYKGNVLLVNGAQDQASMPFQDAFRASLPHSQIVATQALPKTGHQLSNQQTTRALYEGLVLSSYAP